MGILKQAADVVYTIRFLKLLVTKFEDTGAFKAGIIDKDGNKNKDFDLGRMENRDAYRDHYTSFHRLVFNLKKIMAKAARRFFCGRTLWCSTRPYQRTR